MSVELTVEKEFLDQFVNRRFKEILEEGGYAWDLVSEEEIAIAVLQAEEEYNDMKQLSEKSAENLHECAETFHREITNEEAAECIKDLFLSIADGAKNEQ